MELWTGIAEATCFQELSDEDIELAIRMEMAIMPTEITISAGETRQKQQYEPYTYHSTMRLDCSDLAKAVKHAYETAPEGHKLSTYVRAKKLMYRVIASKFDAHERYQRDLIHIQEEKDGIIPHK